MKERAFITLTNGFKDKLYRLAKRLLVSNEEAEDATQEVLLKLWRNKTKMAEYKNVEAFAMTMTKNYCYDKLKAKEAGNLKIVHSNYKDERPSLQREVEARDSLDWVGKIMDGLPEQQRMIVQLRDIEQYDNAEIAEMLEMNETAVRVALSRGRKTIRQELLKKHNYGVV
ncbi:RNA polymerase sigma factor [uncultured Aquimarina sp.]|uniref:RNA polymerase sigma factor n=1 Tax=uncultured Aquimarina sp. TaxID=575652 RepID=UPI00261758C0|nr:RNA polymerase sigma factor [uncultured Aquimarina sp.]